MGKIYSGLRTPGGAAFLLVSHSVMDSAMMGNLVWLQVDQHTTDPLRSLPPVLAEMMVSGLPCKHGFWNGSCQREQLETKESSHLTLGVHVGRYPLLSSICISV